MKPLVSLRPRGRCALHLHFTQPNRSDDSEMTDDDIIFRYEKGKVIGLTILHVSKRFAALPLPTRS